MEEQVKNEIRIDLSRAEKEAVRPLLKHILLNEEKPSLFFEELRATHQLDVWFSELKALIGLPQNETAHQEGDVWTHTFMVVDEAAKRKDSADNSFGLMLSALCHDFGKAVTLTVDDNGIHHSYEHETKGLPLVKAFLDRLGIDIPTSGYVLNMVELHQEPHKKVRQQSSQKSFNHMFDRSICPMDLIALADCDNRGKIPANTGEVEVLYDKFNVFCNIMAAPYVTSKDLENAGIPKERVNELLAFAHKLRLAGVAYEYALKQTLAKK